jgi:hypothetical protein
VVGGRYTSLLGTKQWNVVPFNKTVRMKSSVSVQLGQDVRSSYNVMGTWKEMESSFMWKA